MTRVVESLNGHLLAKADVGLSNADNTSDAGKPVSTAQQTALDLKLAIPAGSDDDLLQRKSGLWVPRTIAQVKADLAEQLSIADLSDVDFAGGFGAGSGKLLIGYSPSMGVVHWHAITQGALKTEMGLDVGVNVQAFDADLATIAGLTATTDSFLQAKSGNWAARTIAQVKSDLGIDAYPVSRLTYVAASDLLSGAALTANTATDVTANQNFTATATGIYTVMVRSAVLVTATAIFEFAIRAIINSAGTLINVKVDGGAGLANGYGIAGSGAFRLGPGLPVGTNTIKLQVVPSVNATGYCRANTQPNFEYAEMQIHQELP